MSEQKTAKHADDNTTTAAIQETGYGQDEDSFAIVSSSLSTNIKKQNLCIVRQSLYLGPTSYNYKFCQCKKLRGSLTCIFKWEHYFVGEKGNICYLY